MSEEVETFWGRCREQRSLPPNPNRFAVQTVKALLRQLLDEDVVMVIHRKCGWDMLLKADSHHYAVGLLARELCRISCSFCRSVAASLIPRLSREEPLRSRLGRCLHPVLLPGPSPGRVRAPAGRAPRHCSLPFRCCTA
ncbi:maestro heat-like repeat-containing protein family member 7 [Neopelma chrysocephalum]|uniref:maestro heat-like repeat-containing protein family member 7 n=1 Tax=Neopelma chrysocephalum TaxID=114329 RepID=UPI000FCD21AE|nr:maestro heat-like repeat-containing protein family member 7 [Neopelma chrysocephalum]